MVESFRHTILLLILMALAVSSCETQEPADPTPSAELEFDVAPLSRTTATTSENLKLLPFAVYSDWKRTEDIIHDGFRGERVAYDASVAAWTHQGTQYWWPEFEHSFVAVHPFDMGNTTYKTINYKASALSFKVLQLSDYSKMSDILIATHRRNFIDGNSSPVCFKFDHIMSNFNIQVTYISPVKDAQALKINSIDLIDIPTQSTFTVTPAPLTGNSTMTSDYVTDPESFEGWTVNQIGRVTIKALKGHESQWDIPADGKPHQLFSAANALILLPNPEESTEMVVTYTTTDSEGSHTNSEEITIPRAWRPGMSYTLSLQFTDRRVLFNIEVEEWQTGESTTTTVPRK